MGLVAGEKVVAIMTVLGVPGAAGAVKVMAVPVRKPLISASAFSGEPAQPENSLVSWLAGTVAVAGRGGVVSVAVWRVVCAKTRELAHSALAIHKCSFFMVFSWLVQAK
jgi:hypothetical protein